MFSNYFKTAWRNLVKNKTFSFINIIGLSIGLACFALIAIFVYDELNYDRYVADAEDIYRVHLSVTGNGSVDEYPSVDYAVGPGMQNAFPEIKEVTQLAPTADFVRYNNQQFKEDKLAFASSNFFQMFSIPLIDGSENNALQQPNTVVVSKHFAQKYFGDEPPVGKTITIGLRDAVYKVTGVFDKIPANTHFNFEAVISLNTFTITNPTWSNLGTFTYLKLNPHANVKKLEAQFPQLVAEHVVPEIQRDMGVSLAEAQKSVGTFVFSLHPLTGIHLYSHTRYELLPNGDVQYVYIFSVLAVFILLLACVNFTNLAIARSVKRAKEVGVRKVMGSGKWQLVKQFLGESVLMSFCAMLIALGLMVLLLPYFNQVAGKQLTTAYFMNAPFLLAMFVLMLVAGIVAGVYPSFFLSAFNPIKVLKGNATAGRQKNMLRSSLVVFQFFVSTTLIISTIVVYQQLRFMHNKKLGYDKEQVLFLPDARLLGRNQDALKQALLQDPRVVAASIARPVPGDDFMDGTQVHAVNDNGNSAEIHMNIYHVDHDFVRTLGMQMRRGRYFSTAFPTDSQAVVINEAAAKELGWANVDPIGKTIVRSGQQSFKVVGVVSDFHYTSAKQKVAPLMMMLGSNYGGLIIKIKTDDVAGLLADLKTKWNSFSPQGPLSYTFLDEKFALLYASEFKTQQIFSAFAIIALIIAGLGLFGLSAFIIEQRAKEIGIRKVLGASVQNVLVLVSKEFMVLVCLAFVLSIPATYWAMHSWLQAYAYRINLSAGVFAMGGLTAIIVALVTISFRALQTARANPVKSLRTE